MDIQEQLFKAIEVITNQQISKLPYNNCIEGIVTSSGQNDDGSYNFMYQDMELTAFPMGNVQYFQGDIIYVMAIGGDLSKKKVILTSKNRTGDLYVDINAEIARLGRAGINYVLNSDGVVYYLQSRPLNEMDLTIEENFIVDSLAQTHILISANVETDLDATVDATYGISIVVRYQNGQEREYALTLNEVTGNVYHAIGRHYTIEPLYLDSNPVSVVRARVYLVGFPDDAAKYVKFSNVRIEFIQQTLVDIANSITYRVDIISTQGNIFKNGQINTVLEARVYKGSEDITDQVDAARFIWKRVSLNTEADTQWNMARGIGTKTIAITKDDIYERATFLCDIEE